MKLNAILIFSILAATFVILLTSLFNQRVVMRPKAAPLASAVVRSKILLNPTRPRILNSPSAPVVEDFIPSFPGKEIAYVTQNGDLYIYSTDLIYMKTLSNYVSATGSSQLSQAPVVYATLRATDTTQTALFTKKVQTQGPTSLLEYNELVEISSVDPTKPEDQLRVTTELLSNE